MHLGLPATTHSSTAEITRIAHRSPLPRAFAAELKLQTIIGDVSSILSHASSGASPADGGGGPPCIDRSVLHLLDRSLESLRNEYPDEWGGSTSTSTGGRTTPQEAGMGGGGTLGVGRMLEYSSLVARVYVYALIVVRASSSSSSSSASSLSYSSAGPIASTSNSNATIADHTNAATREITLKLALSACIRIVQLADSHCSASVPLASSPPSHQHQHQAHPSRLLPKTYFKGLAFATAFLLRYFVLSTDTDTDAAAAAAAADTSAEPATLTPSTPTPDEQQLASNCIVQSHSIFRACVVRPGDEADRLARTFEKLCRQGPIYSSNNNAPPHNTAQHNRRGTAASSYLHGGGGGSGGGAGDGVGVVDLIKVMKDTSGLGPTSPPPPPPPPRFATEPPPLPGFTAGPHNTVPLDPSMVPPELYHHAQHHHGTSMSPPMDPWAAVAAAFPGQNWNDPLWDAFSVPPTTTSPRFYGS